MSIDDFRNACGERPRSPNDQKVDADVAEGLRLVLAFKKIKNQSDRRTVIELAEWLGN